MLITRKTVLPTGQSLMLILSFINHAKAIHSRFVRSQKRTYKWRSNTTYFIIRYLITNNYKHFIEYNGHKREKTADRPENQNVNYRNKKLNVGNSST
jgi:hypothetical protein